MSRSKREPRAATPSASKSSRRGKDRAAIDRCAKMLASPGWHAALEQFARATGLAVTLIDNKGQLCAGPYAPTPLAKRLVEAGGWEARTGKCLETDVGAARDALEEGATVHRKGLDTLALFAVPMRFEGYSFGATVAGWVFDNFPDMASTERLARTLGLLSGVLWQTVRQQPPVSREKLGTYAELLRTLSDSFLRERTQFLHEQEQARELLVLNESGQRLTAAASVGEIGEAVVEATLALARANRARLLVAGEEGKWHTAASRGFADEEGPESASSGKDRRKITGGLVRVPVEAADGSLLGIIEMTGMGSYPVSVSEAQMSALGVQAAIALQKVRTIADLERQRAQLEHNNRVKDEFLSVLSHELRTPLTPILGWVSMLRQGQMRVDAETANMALAAIERNARQELHLVDEMLNLSRILNDKVQLEPEPVDPKDALAAAFAVAQTIAEPRRLQLKLEAEQNLPFISADPRRLQQILSNLASNAIKFTPDDGSITLGARRAGEGSVEFYVQDTGIGIRPEVVPHIFDRFRQGDSSTTRRYGGLGIGLSVVRGLVDIHGARVWAESGGEGRGATFTVRFPAMSAAAAEEERAEAQTRASQAATRKPASGEKRRSGRVLLVDDSEDNLVVIRAMIERAGYQVETADSAETALEAARALVPDVIISDIGMPEFDGYAFLQKLRREAALTDTPVIALTGYVTHTDREAALSAGFAAHLGKPIEQSELVATLDKILTRR